MKRGLKIFGIILAVVFAILLIIPFFVNVDKFRPQIEAKVGEAMNSKVVLGKLSMSLIPSLKISTQTIEVTPLDPQYPEKFLTGSDMKLSLPLWALLGSPSVTIELSKPQLAIIEKNGKYNFETFIKKEATPEKAPEAATESSSFIQNKIEAARLTLKVIEAKVSLRSTKANADVVIDEMLLKNLGLNAPIDIKILSNVNYKSEEIEVKGPFEFSGEVVTSKNGDEIAADFDLIGDFSTMLMKVGSTFQKLEKVPFKFHMKGAFKKGATTDLNVSDLVFELASLKLAGKMAATGIGTETGTVDFDIKNQTSKLEDIAALSPLLNDYKLQGNMSFFAKAKGSVKNPALDIEFKADDLKGKTPKLGLPINELKIKLKVQGTLEEPIVELDPADLLIGKSDLRLRMTAKGLKAPDVKISLESKHLDLAFLKSGKESEAGTSEAEAAKGKALDAALDEMAPGIEKSLKNPMLDKAKVVFTIDFKELKLQGAKLSNVSMQSSYNERNFALKDASFNGYGGQVQMLGASRLNPAAMTYDYTMKLRNIDLAKGIAAHAPEWKGQLSGTLNGTAKLKGAGLRKSQIEKTLTGGIDGEITKGNTSLQLSKIVSTVMKQLPQKPDLKGEVSGDRLKGKFKTLKLNSTLQGRTIAFSNLDIIFEPDEYNLGELQFKAAGTLTFERMMALTGNVFLSPEVVKWPEGVGKSGKIEIPIKVSGPMDAAKPDIQYTIKNMGTRVLKKTAEKELKKGIQKVLEGQKPADVLKNIFKF